MIKVLAFLLAMFFTTSTYAFELLMFHSKYCGYCSAFMEEVAVDYQYRIVDKDLPLIIIDVYNQPDWFKEAYAEERIKPIRGTPTFIVWNGRKELVRIVGYGGKESFYRRLDRIFKGNVQ
jgi:thioredoxin-related protein